MNLKRKQSLELSLFVFQTHPGQKIKDLYFPSLITGGSSSGGARPGAGRPATNHAKGNSTLLDAGFSTAASRQAEEDRRQAALRAEQQRQAQAVCNEQICWAQEEQYVADLKTIRETAERIAAEVNPTSRGERVAAAGGTGSDGSADSQDDENDSFDDDDSDYNYDDGDNAEDFMCADEDNDDDSHSGTVKGSSAKRSAGWQKIYPDTKSHLFKRLKEIKDKILKSNSAEYKQLKNGRKLFGANFDASIVYTEQPTHDPTVFSCDGRICVYVHLPHIQNTKIVPAPPGGDN